jgi:periodic tryptophan protein 1
MEESGQSEKSTISVVKWVPRGAFKLKPTLAVEPTEDEIQDKMDKDDEIILDDDDKNVHDQYDFENYNTIEDVRARLILKKGIQEDMTHYAEEDEIKDDSSDSSVENFELAEDDIELLAINCEDNLTTLQVWVYEESEKNLFLHHDILLSSFGICLEWMGINGSHAAVGTFDPFIEIWDLDVMDPLNPIGTLKKGGHRGPVMSLAWNQQYTNILASGSEDMTVKIWDLATLKCVETLKHHKDKVACLKWHPEEKNILLTGSYDRTLALIDPSKPTKWNEYKIFGDIEALMWNPHKKNEFLASQDNGQVICYDFRNTKEALYTLKAHEGPCTDIAFHPLKEDVLVTCGSDGLKYWDLNAQKCVDVKQTPVGSLYTLSMIDNILAVGGNSDVIQIFPNC